MKLLSSLGLGSVFGLVLLPNSSGGPPGSQLEFSSLCVTQGSFTTSTKSVSCPSKGPIVAKAWIFLGWTRLPLGTGAHTPPPPSLDSPRKARRVPAPQPGLSSTPGFSIKTVIEGTNKLSEVFTERQQHQRQPREHSHVLPCKCAASRSGGHHGELRSGEKMDEERSFRHPTMRVKLEKSPMSCQCSCGACKGGRRENGLFNAGAKLAPPTRSQRVVLP